MKHFKLMDGLFLCNQIKKLKYYIDTCALILSIGGNNSLLKIDETSTIAAES